MLSLPRASYEARLKKTRYDDLKPDISTHAPHTRRDIFTPQCVPRCRDFYSRASYEARPARNWRRHQFLQFLLTRLIRGATYSPLNVCQDVEISTHAPHTRRDQRGTGGGISFYNFYSRASYEARRRTVCCRGGQAEFLLTRLIRGATISRRMIPWKMRISTHAPHTRRDWAFGHAWGLPQFLLTRLIRGATLALLAGGLAVVNFYSRASYEARLTSATSVSVFLKISTHAPHTRRDLHTGVISLGLFMISTHAPHTRRDFHL